MRRLEIALHGRWALLDFVDIPEGSFSLGSSLEEVERCAQLWGHRLVDPAYDIEQFRAWILKECPAHKVWVDAFRMSRFPVTNVEYRRFLAVSSVAVPESIRIAEPDNHPVWGVSFEDAECFARWCGSLLGFAVSLPTEIQWEYAARGRSRREYPFGDAFDPSACNTIEAAIGKTTPVDRYPSGASPFGIFDMAGNVEEWTCSLYEPYPGGVFIEDDLSRRLGARYRILRGGSFARGGDLARCARRHGPLPTPPFRFTGFRLVAGRES